MVRLAYLAVLCVIAGGVVQGTEDFSSADGFTKNELHEEVQDQLGAAISLLDVTLIEGAEEAGDRKFTDEQRAMGEMHIRKLARKHMGDAEEDQEDVQPTITFKSLHDAGLRDSGLDDPNTSMSRDSLKYISQHMQGESNKQEQEQKPEEPDKKQEQKKQQKPEEVDKKQEQKKKEQAALKAKSERPKAKSEEKPKADADKVEPVTDSKTEKDQKAQQENADAAAKQQKVSAKKTSDAKREKRKAELTKQSDDLNSQMREMDHRERSKKSEIKKMENDVKVASNRIVKSRRDKDTDKLPRDALPPVQVHGFQGRVDPAEPRRTFLMNPADTPRGFQYCKDRHTITFTSIEAPDIPASLCGKCEAGFTLMPMTNLGFKMLGICYSIKGLNKRGGAGCDGDDCALNPLPLWNRVKSLPRMTYNDRSCRYFMTTKGWRKKQNYIAKENGAPKSESEKWSRISQESDNKRAHATHCAVTTRTNDASLGEFKDSTAAAKMKKRTSSGKGKWYAESLKHDSPVDIAMPKKSDFQCPEPGEEGCVIGEGWKYDYQELKVAKYSGCYTHLQSRPTLTCDKATQILACNQVRVFSTFSWLEEKTEAGYKIVDKFEVPNDYTVYATERASWWNKGQQARSMYVVDKAPFMCKDGSSRLCRKVWEKRASYLALIALDLKDKPCKLSSCGGPSWTPFQGCQRMMSEAALSLQ